METPSPRDGRSDGGTRAPAVETVADDSDSGSGVGVADEPADDVETGRRRGTRTPMVRDGRGRSVVRFGPDEDMVEAPPALGRPALPAERLPVRTPSHVDLATGSATRRRQLVQKLREHAPAGSRRSLLSWSALGRPFRRSGDPGGSGAGPASDARQPQQPSSGQFSSDFLHGHCPSELSLDAGDEDIPAPPSRALYAPKLAASSRVYRIQAHHSDPDGDYSLTTPATERRFLFCGKERLERTLRRSLTTEYMRWAFRTGMWPVLVSVYLQYLFLILVFATLVWLGSHYQPQCIITDADGSLVDDVLDVPDDFSHIRFMDAFQLSWSTLSTVGYGAIAPQLHIPHNQGQCLGLNALMAFEAFLGLLFASLTGAIVYAKVARIQSVALVRFSDPICVRYGPGCIPLCEEEDEDEDDNNRESLVGDGGCQDSLDEDLSKIPCPILEFRLINKLSARRGGEIMDAAVNVVATTLADVDEFELRSELSRERKSDFKLSAILDMGAGAVGTVGTAATKAAKGMGVAAYTAADAAVALAAKGVEEATHLAAFAAKGVEGAAHMAAKGAGGAAHLAGKGVGPVAKTPIKLAHISGVAMLTQKMKAKQASGSLVQRLNHAMSRSFNVDVPGSQVADLEPYNEDELEKELRNQKIELEFRSQMQMEHGAIIGASSMDRKNISVRVEEGNSVLYPTRIFHKLSVETDTHPFFKRVWTIRHRLDDTSPLLDRSTRLKIAENGGYWPVELNHNEEVRKHLRFKEIICNFSGTSNASGSSVYAQMVYDYSDVNIGYSFANVLSFNRKGVLVADEALVNDVMEQPGGGAEPLTGVMSPNAVA